MLTLYTTVFREPPGMVVRYMLPSYNDIHMFKKNEHNLTKGNILQGILLFSLPILFGSLIQQLYVTADAIIVGQFTGKAGLAAIDSVHTLFRFPINFMNGLCVGSNILISRYMGAKDQKLLQRCTEGAIFLGLLIGILSSVAGYLLAPAFMKWMEIPAEILPSTLSYTRIYFAGLFGIILYNICASVLRAIGDSRLPFYVLVFCAMLNILLDLLLVRVWQLGVSGAALATIFSQFLSALFLIYALISQKLFRLQDLGFRQVDVSSMREILRLGFPPAVQSILFPLSNSIVQASINHMGTNVIAAWGVNEKLNIVIWLIADSMGPVIATFVAQNQGAGYTERVQKGIRTGVLLSLSCVFAFGIVFYFGIPFLASWFIPAPERPAVLPLSIRYMKILAPFFVFYALGEALSGAIQGLGDTLRPMLVTFISICLLRILAIWFVLPVFSNMDCIVWIYAASWIVCGISYLVLWFLQRKELCKM